MALNCRKKNKINIASKFFLASFLALAMLFSRPAKTEAALWPGVDPNIMAAIQKIMDMLQGIIMGQLKIQASKSLNMQVNVLMGGGSGGEAAFITNWQDYLVRQPQDQARAYMNDYLSQMTAGRGSLTGYKSEGFSGAVNYIAQLSESAKSAVNQNIPKVTYEGNPSQMFSGGSFRNMSLYLSGINHPIAFNIAFNAENQRISEEFKLVAQTQAVAYEGVKGTTAGDGKTITNPGSLVKDLVANAQDLPNKIIASAQSMPEVITSVVSQMITRSINQGFASVNAKVSKDINIQARVQSGVNNLVNQNGPGARFNTPTGN